MKIYYHFALEGFSNGYLLGNEKTGEAIIVDPGVMNRELLDHIEKNHFRIDAVLVTHSHESHHRGLQTLLRIYNPRVYAADAELNGKTTILLHGDGSFAAAGYAVRYFAVPGHSPDSLMFQVENILFTGDSLSAGRLGTTNNSYGTRNLKMHLKNKMLSQNDDIVILPGHGPPSTIGAERMFNFELLESENEPIRSPAEDFQVIEAEPL
jgi:glyoxylase-like metal-dependent hydrolase (beta-lactamase superfamily II)